MTYFLLFIISLISGLLVFYQRSNFKKIAVVLLSFSGAYLLSICLLHLLPELFETQKDINLGLYLLIGFFLQLILDYFSGGIEHGHAHVNRRKLGKFPMLIFLSLGVHAFLEALPMHQMTDSGGMASYLIGLSIHKAPISFIFATLLIGYRVKNSLVVVGIILFSLTGPLGVWVGSYFEIAEEFFLRALAISIGIILHLSTTILLETNEEHTIEFKKLLPLIAGVGLALMSLVIH